MTATTPKPLLAAAGAVERLLCRLAASVLPWSNHSQHSAYVAGYADGLRDAATRQRLGLRP